MATYDTQISLPGCQFDTNAIRSLLQDSGKFDEVVVIDGTKASANVKADIAEFFRRYVNTPVDDFLFYFTGHGDVIDDEFRFALRDFDGTRPNATSIASRELDDLVRGIKPAVYCKIVDACHSGVSYVKNGDSILRILEKSKAEFQRCYFLYSCQQDQKSFATERLSDFTYALLESVRAFPSDSMRYADLASALADRFRTSANQTPYFVHQANLTEVFLDLSPEIREALGRLLTTTEEVSEDDPSESPVVTALVLGERVRIDAQGYLEREVATTFLAAVRDTIKQKTLAGALSGLYGCSVEEVYQLSFGEMTIANWLRERRAGSYFVELEYDNVYTDFLGNELNEGEVESIRMRTGRVGSVFGSLYRQTKRLSGFRLTENGPCDVLVLTASPLFPNLPLWKLQLSHAMGPKTVAIFGGVSRMVRSGWASYQTTGKVEWMIKEFGPQQMGGATLVDELFSRFQEQIEDSLKKQFET